MLVTREKKGEKKSVPCVETKSILEVTPFPPCKIGRRSSIIRHMHPVTNKNPTNLIIVPFPTTIHFTS